MFWLDKGLTLVTPPDAENPLQYRYFCPVEQIYVYSGLFIVRSGNQLLTMP
jgi:hypothetical protein